MKSVSGKQSTKKTIMHLISSVFYGGPEKQILEHSVRLDANELRVIVASFTEADKGREFLDKAEAVGLVPLAIPTACAADLRCVAFLRRCMKDLNISLLCVHGYKPTVIGWLASRALGIPVIAFSRGYTTENVKVAFYEWLERLILNRVDGIVAVSKGQAEQLKSMGIKNRRIWVIHNAVSAPGVPIDGSVNLRKAVLKRLCIPENSKIVVSAGRLSPEKGHRFLVEAINKLNKSTNDVYFVFCGDGICREKLEHQVQDLGLANRCRFVGYRRDIYDIFRAMELFVLPSLTEGLPNVVLEAFACAKPVVATHVGGLPEIIDDGIGGILVPPSHPELLAEAIERCIANPTRMQKMGEHGYDKVKSDFTFESQTQGLRKIYHEMLCK